MLEQFYANTYEYLKLEKHIRCSKPSCAACGLYSVLLLSIILQGSQWLRLSFRLRYHEGMRASLSLEPVFDYTSIGYLAIWNMSSVEIRKEHAAVEVF